jgi:hypothetical protein
VAAVGAGAAPPQAAVKIMAAPARPEINRGYRFKISPDYIKLNKLNWATAIAASPRRPL